MGLRNPKKDAIRHAVGQVVSMEDPVDLAELVTLVMKKSKQTKEDVEQVLFEIIFNAL